MNQAAKDYIATARAAKLSDETILSQMVAAGWPKDIVEAALSGKEIPLPPPPPPSTVTASPGNINPALTPQPVSVVQNFTTRGLEYLIMFISMGISAMGLGWMLHGMVDNAVNGSTSGFYGDTVSMAGSALLVTLPVFVILFLRLKKAELTEPALRQDPSRRKGVQLTLVLTFLIGLFHIVSYIFGLLNGQSSGLRSAESFTGNLLHMMVTLTIAGGIFAYYWHDVHKTG